MNLERLNLLLSRITDRSGKRIRTKDIEAYWLEWFGPPKDYLTHAGDTIQFLCRRLRHLERQERRTGAKKRSMRRKMEEMYEVIRGRWQTIETAPQETQILLLVPPETITIGYVRSGSRLVDSNNGHTVHALSAFSHWAPVPSPPVIEEEPC